MNLARIIGTIWATRKHKSLEGTKLLIIEPLDLITRKAIGSPFVSVDSIGAGEGEYVFYVTSKESEMPLVNKGIAKMVVVDACILGIVQRIDTDEDTFNAELQASQRKSEK